MLRLQELLGSFIKANELGTMVEENCNKDNVTFVDASHHMGTTRMSEQPKNGVVDHNCKVHGICNLFIAGSSVFSTCGHVNPTLTIVALALRLAERLNQLQN
jgi:choline dehydrogenase-like flavoprotein